MKYILTVFLVLVFVGCGNNNSKDQDNPPEVKEGIDAPPSIPKI